MKINTRDNGAFQRALKYKDAGSYNKAEKIILKLLENDGKNSYYIFQLAIIYAHLSDYSKSLKYFTILDGLQPNTAWILNNKAIVLLKLGAIEKAEDIFLEALNLDQNNFDIKINLISIYNSTERSNKSLLLLKLITVKLFNY
jgi:tetratricopeptide (TPR) repeat protein